MIKFLQKNKDISNLSNFKTNAVAKYYYEINNRQDLDNLSKIFSFSQKNNLEMLFIGGGTNLLFAFDFFDGVIIKNNLFGWIYNQNNNILEANSGEVISDIAKSLENDFGQSLWHRFIGLPGTIGGAVYGNAGCFGLEAESNFSEAEILNLDTGKIEFLNKIDMKFSYRSSFLKESKNYFLISAKFDLSEKLEKYSSLVDNIDFRENKQPKGNTCGSFFKNPSKDNSAGKLIEQVGLKGFKIGGAYFSSIHANFLMNDGTASYKDLINLIDLAKNKVKKDTGIDLIPEVKIIYHLK